MSLQSFLFPSRGDDGTIITGVAVVRKSRDFMQQNPGKEFDSVWASIVF